MAKETKEEYIQQRIIELKADLEKTQEESEHYKCLSDYARLETNHWLTLYGKSQDNVKMLENGFTRKSFLGFVYYRMKQ